MAVEPIPPGFHTVTPYLILDGAAMTIEFAKAAFDAEEMGIHRKPDGSIMHAEVRIGNSIVMLADAHGEYQAMPSMLHLYVEDVDSVYQKAMAAGGQSLREPTNEFYGDRSGGVLDPCGNRWWIATHVEDVTPEEIAKRQAAMGMG